MARTLIESEESPYRPSTDSCLLSQASLEGHPQQALFGSALGFHAVYVSAVSATASLSVDTKRLLYHVACSTFCGDDFAREPVTSSMLCNAAVANTPEFFALYGCEPVTRMAQAGVCEIP